MSLQQMLGGRVVNICKTGKEYLNALKYILSFVLFLDKIWKLLTYYMPFSIKPLKVINSQKQSIFGPPCIIVDNIFNGYIIDISELLIL